MKGRSLIRQVLARCNICRRYEGRLYTTPPPPPLPSFHVQESPPFSVVEVNFAGPLFVRVKKEQFSKVWICLFTCGVTRAVHLDLVTDLTAPTFIRVLKRFSARWGFPRKFISDNRKTFKYSCSQSTQDHRHQHRSATVFFYFRNTMGVHLAKGSVVGWDV